MDKRKEHVDLAKLAEQAERYEDMVQEMKSVVINAEGDLTDEERNLLSVAYKNVVGARRSAWRIIESLEKKAVDEEKANLARQYRETVETELKDQCNEVLVLIDEHLLEKTSEEKFEARVFYLKMKGDYYRYLVEIESDRQETVAKSKQAYTDARELASEKLLKTHPISLGLALNFSVFYYEIEGKPDKACKVAKEAFDDAIAQLDNIREDSYKDSTLIMQLLRDNLTLWEAQDREDEQAAD